MRLFQLLCFLAFVAGIHAHAIAPHVAHHVEARNSDSPQVDADEHDPSQLTAIDPSQIMDTDPATGGLFPSPPVCGHAWPRGVDFGFGMWIRDQCKDMQYWHNAFTNINCGLCTWWESRNCTGRVTRRVTEGDWGMEDSRSYICLGDKTPPSDYD